MRGQDGFLFEAGIVHIHWLIEDDRLLSPPQRLRPPQPAGRRPRAHLEVDE